MVYCYESSDGDLIERHFAIGQAPEAVTHEGKRYARSYRAEFKQVDAALAEKCRGYPMVSHAAPQWSGEGIRGVSHRGDGKVVFENHTAKREYCRANGYTRDF